MNIRKFLENYQQLQYSIMGDILINLDCASITINNTDKSGFWNHGMLRRTIAETELKEIESILDKYDRKHSLYFSSEFQNELETILQKNSYKKEWEDSWMFHSGNIPNENNLVDIRIVQDEAELGVFLNTFDQCYRKDDPQNPYGELGDYLKVTEKVWRLHNETGRIQYIIAFDSKNPVAVATLTNFGDIGYISNVGSLRSVRGKGFGKAVSVFAVRKSLENGNTLHCLATEEGHYPYDFYKRIGFEPKFTAVGYVKTKE